VMKMIDTMCWEKIDLKKVKRVRQF
jgi:hypothetical protein